MESIDTLYRILGPLTRFTPTLRIDDPVEQAVLRQKMRLIIDNPLVRAMPILSIAMPVVACLALWSLTQSVGIAIGAAMLLYAQLSAISSRHVVTAIWAATTLGLRKAIARGSMSVEAADDLDLVQNASRALSLYGLALMYIIPALFTLVAVALLWPTLVAGDLAGATPSLLVLCLATILAATYITFVPNRAFFRYADQILIKGRGA